MPGGPIGPSSVYLGGASGNLFPYFYAGAGGNASSHDEGIGVVASLGGNATAELRFPMPPAIPAGQLKLMLRCVANATSGVAKITPNDASCGTGVSPSALTLTADAQQTLTWAAGDNDKYKDAKVNLSSIPNPNDSLVVALTFNNTGWTLASNLNVLTWVLWE
jgi:hypothetical protein